MISPPKRGIRYNIGLIDNFMLKWGPFRDYWIIHDFELWHKLSRQKLKPLELWPQSMAELRERLVQCEYTEALCDSIEDVAEILEERFPGWPKLQGLGVYEISCLIMEVFWMYEGPDGETNWDSEDDSDDEEEEEEEEDENREKKQAETDKVEVRKETGKSNEIVDEKKEDTKEQQQKEKKPKDNMRGNGVFGRRPQEYRAEQLINFPASSDVPPLPFTRKQTSLTEMFVKDGTCEDVVLYCTTNAYWDLNHLEHLEFYPQHGVRCASAYSQLNARTPGTAYWSTSPAMAMWDFVRKEAINVAAELVGLQKHKHLSREEKKQWMRDSERIPKDLDELSRKPWSLLVEARWSKEDWWKEEHKSGYEVNDLYTLGRNTGILGHNNSQYKSSWYHLGADEDDFIEMNRSKKKWESPTAHNFGFVVGKSRGDPHHPELMSKEHQEVLGDDVGYVATCTYDAFTKMKSKVVAIHAIGVPEEAKTSYLSKRQEESAEAKYYKEHGRDEWLRKYHPDDSDAPAGNLLMYEKLEQLQLMKEDSADQKSNEQGGKEQTAFIKQNSRARFGTTHKLEQ
ncbi:hypothetical protein BJ508DRAFT_329065 [Ascobolus immersus RN42]|uniref:Uncharacterized protein n=1 Tax=Ascobolus immersus RN42 TaxID=1160509 RepID=A0A3N4HXM9_ASCIM|nr:hypothetical protein BJ508DRAFT_329065 [Ascobolus immersus RN42]